MSSTEFNRHVRAANAPGADRRIVTDPEFMEAVKKTGVEVVTWKQVRKMSEEKGAEK